MLVDYSSTTKESSARENKTLALYVNWKKKNFLFFGTQVEMWTSKIQFCVL